VSKDRERRRVRRPMVRLAAWAGTLVRVTRRPVATARQAALGVLGAVAVAVGAGEVAEHVFGRHLALWVALVVGGAIAMFFGAELNREPPAPPADS
jgi:hypothetical protein